MTCFVSYKCKFNNYNPLNWVPNDLRRLMKNNADKKVVLEATNEKALETISMDVLLKYAYFKDKV